MILAGIHPLRSGEPIQEWSIRLSTWHPVWARRCQCSIQGTCLGSRPRSLGHRCWCKKSVPKMIQNLWLWSRLPVQPLRVTEPTSGKASPLTPRQIRLGVLVWGRSFAVGNLQKVSSLIQEMLAPVSYRPWAGTELKWGLKSICQKARAAITRLPTGAFSPKSSTAASLPASPQPSSSSSSMFWSINEPCCRSERSKSITARLQIHQTCQTSTSFLTFWLHLLCLCPSPFQLHTTTCDPSKILPPTLTTLKSGQNLPFKSQILSLVKISESCLADKVN